MKVLQVVKTSEGARWAAQQAAVLTRLGVEVHVAVPAAQGQTIAEWRQSGAEIHVSDLSLPVSRPWTVGRVLGRARALVESVAPDIIHSHFVSTTLTLRYALGRRHPTPRIFQVPGPLHLEHWPYRLWELSSAGERDFWIASSRCIEQLYRRAGVLPEKLFLSYYGNRLDAISSVRSGRLRTELGIPADAMLVGNASFFYPPKYFLGQTTGLKGHEILIDALGPLLGRHPRLHVALVGGALHGGAWYERRLRERARTVGGDRLRMPGRMAPESVDNAMADFDLVVHVPLSENCGGVLVPLAAGVPVIASAVGGLPEVVIDGVTGRTVASRRPEALSAAIEDFLSDRARHRQYSARGQRLVRRMFDVERTAREVHAVYRHILDSRCPRPVPFDSIEFAGGLDQGAPGWEGAA